MNIQKKMTKAHILLHTKRRDVKVVTNVTIQTRLTVWKQICTNYVPQSGTNLTLFTGNIADRFRGCFPATIYRKISESPNVESCPGVSTSHFTYSTMLNFSIPLFNSRKSSILIDCNIYSIVCVSARNCLVDMMEDLEPGKPFQKTAKCFKQLQKCLS